MKKNYLILGILSLLTLSACGNKPTPEPKKLDVPVLKLNEAKNGLVWDPIAEAEQYEVVVNEEEPVKATNYTFSDVVGQYSVKVRALNKDLIGDFSVPFEYSTKQCQLGDLSCQNNQITWSTFEGNKLEYKQGNEKFVELVGDSLVITEKGVYTFRPVGGYNEKSHINYLPSTIKKTIVATPSATSTLILEDGTEEDDATLQESYSIFKYDSDWKPSTATVTLSSMNEGFTPNKCVQYQYWRHGAYFKFDKELAAEQSFDTLSFYIKGDGFSKLSLVFEISKSLVIEGMDLTGAYLIYTIDKVEACWKKYTINMNDAAWQIDYGGVKSSVKDILDILKASNIIIQSVADLMPYFNTFSIRCFAQPDENWSTTKIWMDEIVLSNVGARSSVETLVALSKYYTIEAENGCSGSLSIGDTNVLTVNDGESFEFTEEVNVEKTSEGKIIIYLDDPEDGFMYTGVTNDSGYSFAYESCTGILARYLERANLVTSDVYMVDDFESYESTGVGFDKNHTKDLRSGLRANYYSDYYDGNSGSPLGGNGWSLMGSTDYLDLVNSGRNGGKAAKLKYNSSCAMRLISYGLYEGNATAIGKGTTFSFFAKGATIDITIKVRVYYVNKVTPTNQQLDSTLLDGVVIPANSDWSEYKVNLDSSKTYYGFSITTVVKGGSTAYFYIDDISIYGKVSPWSK